MFTQQLSADDEPDEQLCGVVEQLLCEPAETCWANPSRTATERKASLLTLDMVCEVVYMGRVAKLKRGGRGIAEYLYVDACFGRAGDGAVDVDHVGALKGEAQGPIGRWCRWRETCRRPVAGGRCSTVVGTAMSYHLEKRADRRRRRPDGQAVRWWTSPTEPGTDVAFACRSKPRRKRRMEEDTPFIKRNVISRREVHIDIGISSSLPSQTLRLA